MPRLTLDPLVGTLAGGLLCACAGGTTVARSAPPGPTAPPALDAIVTDDIRRDLFALAGDAMRGREAGTLDELRASAWIAERARAAGLEPAGDDGTYFQFWPMRRTVTSKSSVVQIDGRPVRLGADAYVVTLLNATRSGPVTWIGTPAVYFSTLPHRLYHTPADDPASINVEKVARVARWMYATGWAVATTDRRPNREEAFKLER